MTLILSGTDGVSDIDGTAATPAIRGTDANTGIFFPAADTIAFAEGGAEAMRIDSSGNVGIGTSSPAANTRLNVASSGETKINMTTTGTGSGTRIFLNNQNGYDLEILSSGDASGVNNLGLASNSQTGVGANYILSGTKLAIGTYNNYETIFGTNNAERMRIDSSGNVGIGTSSPTDGDGYGRIIDIRSATGGAIYFRDSDDITNDTLVIGRDSANSYIDSKSGNLIIYNAGSERARITSGGYFKASNDGSYYSSTSANHELRTNGNDWTALISSITSTAGNCYGIRIVYPNATPNSSTDNQFIYCDDSTNIKFTVYSNGTVTNRTGTYNSFSDLKLKQDVVDANSQWDDIKALRIVKYRLKDEVAADPNYPAYIGVIAQEVEQVSPGLVDNCPDFENVIKTREVEKTREVTPAVLNDEGNEVTPAVTETYTDTEEYTERVATGTVTKSVKSSIIYMKAVKALQEAMTRIETLEAQNAAFEARLAALENK